ncbi:MAG: amidase family protein, partial [Bellilinea sp.]|nr:amidase family protein [Bellilinea sp.]
METLQYLTVRQALNALQSGSLSSEELTRACLEQIERLEGEIHAFITLAAEKALQEARLTDQRRLAARRHPDEPLPPLLGLPIAVKDVLTVAGLRCTCGSRILENFIPPFTATAVQRLLDAGVVIVGKTNTDEFAMGSSTENSSVQITKNPWDLDRIPGGSSGGSAGATSAGLCVASLGTDTGGSIR